MDITDQFNSAAREFGEVTLIGQAAKNVQRAGNPLVAAAFAAATADSAIYSNAPASCSRICSRNMVNTSLSPLEKVELIRRLHAALQSIIAP